MEVRRRRRARVAAGIGVGLALGVAAAMLGPSEAIGCGGGHLLDRLAQRIMQPLGAGQVDGASATSCTVPSTASWLLAVAAILVAAGVTLTTARRGKPVPPLAS
jgi:hypothetical protein